MVSFPLNIHIGILEIPSHLVFYLLAFYVGFSYYYSLRNKKYDYISANNRITLLIGAAIGALLFSKLLSALENPVLFFNPPSWIYYIQGETILGGLLGGLIGVEITKKIIGEKNSSGDLFTYPLILGIAIGRIGCFLTGVSDKTVGLASKLPWAFNQGDGIPRHPTSLYEIIFLILLWVILSKIQKLSKLKEGSIFKIFMFSYLLFRFAVEFIKPVIPLVFGLSTLQIACLLGLVYYGIMIAKKGL